MFNRLTLQTCDDILSMLDMEGIQYTYEPYPLGFVIFILHSNPRLEIRVVEKYIPRDNFDVVIEVREITKKPARVGRYKQIGENLIKRIRRNLQNE